MSKSNSDPVLACNGLTVGYSNTPILRDIHCTFEQGQFISLLGPNGAGKTTLLRTLSRHLPPLSGSVAVMGRELQAMPALDLARIMAVVLTNKISPPLFSVYEFVALGRYPHTNYLGTLNFHDKESILQSLQAVHAANLASRPFSDLSDGERQKVLVARALAQEPKLLLLDEPTIHLDLKHRVEVMSILRDLCRTKGITVIASLHDVDVAAKVSDQVALIKDSSVQHYGAPEEVLTQQAVTTLYDFDKAEFNSRLGGIELRSDGNSGKAFVLAGMASGSHVYRMLAKKGFSFATGVLHTNDLDFFVADSLGGTCITVPAMETINGTATAKAHEQLAQCDVVIDCGFALGNHNMANGELLQTALEMGKPLFSLRTPDAGKKLNTQNGNYIQLKNVAELITTLDNYLPGKQHGLKTAGPAHMKEV
ncbi:ABC transporter ATP-binding protein [Desulfogranum japonicum]|uniref:ABC transporter ATP-binding protein n=1 Tax=Desulfogranum japonicum TaxID=231447 RepID=UPI0003FBAED2|nr:ABC transporter ATP-binding protein [Desulfogranum japonicum]